MSDKPFLSVVMPVHDGAAWIGATLDSLVAEPTDGVEIIIIDSSPLEATADIAESYVDRLPLRLLRRTDLKPWQTKTNLGVALAGADHVCMLHQDDLWLPGRVRAIRTWLAGAPNAVLHLAPTLMVDRLGRQVGSWSCPLPAGTIVTTEFLLQRLLVQNFVSVPAPVFRRDAWLSCGGMDERLWYTPDWDIWAKLSSAGPVVYHNETTTAFRLHGGSLTVTGSRDAREFREQMLIVLERYLDSIAAGERRMIERVARASINVNVALAAASRGSLKGLFAALGNVLSLGPAGIARYLRDSRLYDRVIPRLRAKAIGAF